MTHSVHRGRLVFISLHCLNPFQTSEAAFIFYSCGKVIQLHQRSKYHAAYYELTIINYLMYPLYC